MTHSRTHGCGEGRTRFDHRDCVGSPALLGAARREHRTLPPPDREDVRWDRRSLYSFGEGDLGTFAENYDLVIYDHPFVGDAREQGWLLDLNAFLTQTQKAYFADDEVGASWRSYAYGGGIWGLPIDTAAQTAAWRADLLETPWPGRAAIARRSPGVRRPRARPSAFRSAGRPSRPTSCAPWFRSPRASASIRATTKGASCRARQSESAARHLKLLARMTHPKSREWNPIRCLDHMATSDDVAYVPYLFNYVNYSSGSPARPITFGAPPAAPKGFAGTDAAWRRGHRRQRQVGQPAGRVRLRHASLLARLSVGRLCDLRRAARQPHGVAVGRLQRDHRRLLPQHAPGDGPGLSQADPCRVSFHSSTTRR